MPFFIHLISKGHVVVFKCKFKPGLNRYINYCHVQTIKVIWTHVNKNIHSTIQTDITEKQKFLPLFPRDNHYSVFGATFLEDNLAPHVNLYLKILMF